jgi:hypothetical protein
MSKTEILDQLTLKTAKDMIRTLLSIVLLAANLTSEEQNNQSYMIFTKIIDEVSTGKTNTHFTIVDSTTSRHFSTELVSNIYNHTLDPSVKNLDKADWKSFIKTVENNNLKTNKLIFSSSFNRKIQKMLKRKLHYKIDEERDSVLLFFSPILFSSKNNKAVCSLFSYRGRESSNTTYYFLERDITGKWMVYTRIMTDIS